MTGTKQKFEDIYDQNYSYVYNYIYMQVQHRQNTEDIVSDVFMKAYTHYDGFDPALASARTWLCTIARNTLVDFYRKNGRAETVDLDDAPEISTDDTYEVLQDPVNAEVKRILDKLSPDEREFLSLRYGQDMKNEDIGRMYGINAKAVSERYRRLLAKCRKLAGNIDIVDLLS